MKTYTCAVRVIFLFLLLTSCANQPEENPNTPSASPLPLTEPPTPFATKFPLSPSPTITPTTMSSPTPPLPSVTPTETATATIIPTPPSPTPSATSTLVPVESPLSEWPLNMGNYWVYISINVENGQNATYIMTDTVKQTKVIAGYFVAEVQRTSRLVHGDSSVGLNDEVLPGDFWYVVSVVDDTFRVYFQRRFDLNALETSWLSYKFPLEEGECWGSDSHTADLMGCNTRVLSFGFFNLSTGDISGCYDIRVVTFVGGGSSLFCPGIGIARREFTLNSTEIGSTTVPFRYEEILIEFGQK